MEERINDIHFDLTGLVGWRYVLRLVGLSVSTSSILKYYCIITFILCTYGVIHTEYPYDTSAEAFSNSEKPDIL